MAELSVRKLAEREWPEYRSLRLRALQESPEAFVATYEDEAAKPDSFWQQRLERATRLVAEKDGEAVGITSVRAWDLDDGDKIAEIFGLWVAPELRGTGAASKLVLAACDAASAAGLRKITYWVGTDNGRAVAFASSYGFRPTEHRRPVRASDGSESTEELAMVLALS